MFEGNMMLFVVGAGHAVAKLQRAAANLRSKTLLLQ